MNVLFQILKRYCYRDTMRYTHQLKMLTRKCSILEHRISFNVRSNSEMSIVVGINNAGGISLNDGKEDVAMFFGDIDGVGFLQKENLTQTFVAVSSLMSSEPF